MKITQALMDDLTEQAQNSPRLRMNLDLRNSSEDGSQWMLNPFPSFFYAFPIPSDRTGGTRRPDVMGL